MDKVKEYLKQPSTYQGIALLLSLSGVAFAPVAVEAICAGIILGIGLYETVRNEKVVK